MTNTTHGPYDKARRDATAAIDLATRLLAAINAADAGDGSDETIAIEAAELAWYATTIEEAHDDK